MKHLRKVHNIERNKLKTLAENTKKASKDVAISKNRKDFGSSFSEIKSESGMESTSPEISLDTYIFAESDDSTMDSIDPMIIKKDWCILNENSLIDSSLQYIDMLPVSHTTFETGKYFFEYICTC